MEVQATALHLEDFLKETGWGLFYKFTISIACLCHMIQGVTFVTMAYTVALSSCTDLQIPEINSLRIFTTYLIGSAVGGLLGNALADRYGRKRSLVNSLICIFSASFTAAFSYNIYVVIAASFILGTALEINSLQVKLLVVEVLGKEDRGFWMAFCNLFWAVGYVIITLSVVLCETATIFDWDWNTPKQLTTWRTMFAVCGGASLVLACACALLEESPRFYLLTGRNYMAYLLLKQLYAINKSNFADNFKVQEDNLTNLIPKYELNYPEPSSLSEKIKFFFIRLYKSVKVIFSKPFRQSTALLMALKTPLIVIGLFQLNICLAKFLVANPQLELSEKFKTLDFTLPVLEPELNLPEEKLNSSTKICTNTQANITFYGTVFILSLAVLPGEIISMMLLDRMGRKLIAFSGLLIASSSLLVLGFINQIAVQMVTMCLVMASMGAVVSTVSLINLEVVPTAVRSTCNTLSNIPGFIIGVLFINLIDIERQLFIIILGIMYFCFSIFTCFLQETKKKPMVE